MLDLCQLVDLGFEEYPFTWSNGQMDKENIQCHLDKGFAKDNFINSLCPIRVLHPSRFGSDHATINIVLEAPSRKHVHLFKFEEVWSRDPRCGDLLGKLWNETGARGHQKMKEIQKIEDSSREYKVGAMSKEIKRIETLLKDDSNWSANEDDLSHYKALEVQKNNLLLEK